jgi:hypothetical protein
VSAFDPTKHGFAELDHETPWELAFFEYRAHPCVNGETNHCRLNLYMSRDNDYVHIWYGLLEPEITRGHLTRLSVEVPDEFDLADYNEPLFRGYIESDDQAQHILNALRLKSWSMNELRGDESGQLACQPLERIAPDLDR